MVVSVIPTLLIAFALGGHAPAVTCNLTDGHTGWTTTNGQVYLAPFVCQWVTSRNLDQQAFGLYVILHEAAHVSGIKSELRADCSAIRLTYPAAIRVLHTSRIRATQLALRVKAYHDQEPPPYTGSCSTA